MLSREYIQIARVCGEKFSPLGKLYMHSSSYFRPEDIFI